MSGTTSVFDWGQRLPLPPIDTNSRPTTSSSQHDPDIAPWETPSPDDLVCLYALHGTELLTDYLDSPQRLQDAVSRFRHPNLLSHLPSLSPGNPSSVNLAPVISSTGPEQTLLWNLALIR
jgi:hypothetical protein